MGTFGWEGESAGDYTLNANTEVNLLPLGEVLLEELGEAAGGFFTALGGVSLLACGACFALLGGILAAVRNDPKDAKHIQQPPSV